MADFHADSLPPELLTTGISLKLQHYPEVISPEVLTAEPAGLWFEAHTENFCAIGGARLAALQQVAERYPISLHGVGASLAGPESLNPQHLQWVRALVRQVKPALISEHAVWSVFDQAYFADLLPMPRSELALQQLSSKVQQYQDSVARPILLENPTHYLRLKHQMPEPAFMTELCRRTGCGLLLDITNLYLSQNNCAEDARHYLDQIPAHLVGELHIAGYSADPIEGESLLIDSHDQPPNQGILQLLDYALQRFGARPVLLEWDDQIPALPELLRQRARVAKVLQPYQEVVHATK